MPYLIAATTLLGILCVFNLLLLLGVVRRVRQQSISPQPAQGPGVGDEIAQFSAQTTRNEEVTADTIQDGTVVAFFMPNCGPCHEIMPRFIEYAEAPGTATLAVMLSADSDSADDLRRLESVTDVVVESFLGTVATAFKVKSTPTFVTVMDGKVKQLGLPEINENVPA
ncbi:TlpA family protein disulfide reductase [Streptosporangium roseum]|uniref:TlpA family protein disulfide reductase n=1 Tax=Streptosporangium roseum TaxID=2001 RepID=UPI00068B7A05|nr:thioredoxin family protein [Streptosporangium roseum]